MNNYSTLKTFADNKMNLILPFPTKSMKEGSKTLLEKENMGVTSISSFSNSVFNWTNFPSLENMGL